MTDVETDQRHGAESASGDPADTRPTRATGPLARLAASGFSRIAGISASLVGTHALTSVLGLLFWTIAARTFLPAEVGVAGAAIALMMLLGSLGSLGLGTVLIARLPLTAPAERRLLVRTCVAAAGLGGTVLGLAVPAVAVHGLGVTALAPVAGSIGPALVLGLGTGLTAATLVLDQAVLTVGVGTLQLERNVTASAVKIVALVALALAPVPGGVAIVLAWVVGTALSMPVVAWRSRRRGAVAPPSRPIDPRVLRGLGRLAVSHHALNVSLQAALQLLPVLVTVLVSASANAAFNAALMVSGFVFALPYAVSVGLFAAARGVESEVVARMRLTIPFGLAVSASAYLVLFPLAGLVLQFFGPAYSDDGAVLLRLVVLAGLPFVIKDHFIALRRVQGRTTQALVLITGFLVAELAGAAIGATFAGAVGLCVGWLVVLAVEALVLLLPLIRAMRHGSRGAGSTAPATAPSTPATVVPAATIGSADTTVPATAPIIDPPIPVPAARRTSTLPALAPRPAGATRSRWTSRNLAGPTLLVMSLGVLVMAAAANAARAAGPGGLPQLGWVLGLVILFAPAAVRIVLPATPGRERLLVAVGLAMLLQVSRLVLNPTQFVFHDELIHANTLRQIDVTGHLFSSNPLLPVSGYYPGLEVATSGVEALTGLAPFAASALVLLAARLVLALAIVALVELVAGSRRAGAVGLLVYLVNPQLLFFNSQYSYQTLALPLAALAIVLAAGARGRRGGLLAAAATTTAVAVTHHLTGVLLVAAFAAWTVLVAVRGRAPGIARHALPAARNRFAEAGGFTPALLTVWGALSVSGTLLVPGNPLQPYLAAIFGSSAGEVRGLSEGHRTKALFADTAGTGPAPWEQVLLIAAVLIAMLSVLAALGALRAGWRGWSPLALLLGLVALAYPVIPGGHLTRATAEVGDRTAGFVFVGTALVVGAWWWGRRRSSPGALLLAGACTVAFLGDVVLGAGPTAGQLPGPYQISADARSIDADNLAAAEWLQHGVPADSAVYGDRTSGLLAAAIGGQDSLTHVGTGIDLSRLLLAPDVGTVDRALVRRTHLRFLIVDRRLSGGLPHQQFYVESGEYGGDSRVRPVTAGALAKFLSVPGVSRLYDNGSLAVYDLRGLR